jgi:hypothetical protein
MTVMPYVNSKEQMPLIILRTICRYEGRLLFSPILITDNFGMKLYLRIYRYFGAGMFFRNSTNKPIYLCFQISDNYNMNTAQRNTVFIMETLSLDVFEYRITEGRTIDTASTQTI